MTHSSIECERLTALHDLCILGTTPEAHLDAVCRVAADLFEVPIALITLVDQDTISIKAAHGVEPNTISRLDAFCHETIEAVPGKQLILPDIHQNERWRDSPLVSGKPNVRFYGGVPLALTSGLNIGTLCIMDRVPRLDFGSSETERLHDLAKIVEAHFRLHEARVVRDRDEERYRFLADNSTDVIMRSDLNAIRRYVSPAVRSLLGYEPEDLIGTHPFESLHPDDFETFTSNMEGIASARIEKGTACQRYRHKDGRWIWVEVTFGLTRNPETGAADGSVSSLRDVTDRKAMEESLRISEERLSLALDSGSDGLWDWNITTDEIRLSGHWMTILGYGEGEISLNIQSWTSLLHPEDVERSKHLLIAHLKGQTDRLECEYRMRAKNGGYLWALARGKVVTRDARGHATRMVGTKIDITRRKEAERMIEHMAAHDALTGLPNRTLFRDRLARETLHARQHGNTIAVLACDLDGFKNVNDTAGHAAGDAVLHLVAERMKAIVREGDMVARLGGDEFAVILGQPTDNDSATTVARRIIEAIELPFTVEGRTLRISVSVGIATERAQSANADRLVKNADIALYKSKAAGRNTYCCFKAGMEAQVADRAALERDIKDALQTGGLSLDYQPVLLLANQQIVGFEALMRWKHPTRGKVPPSEFIPIAEESGLIVCLGEWALYQACREAASWPDHLRIAVNVSAVQFRQSDLEDCVRKTLVSTGLPAERLELEITESVLIQDAEAVIASLHRLRAIGVRIALDDFGTGYSSLSYLRQFPFNKIKIDRAFVQDIDDPNTAAIVRAVVGLGKRVGAAITAEGVETEEQMRRIEQEGCTEVQGYLFGAPMPVCDARALIGRSVRSAA